ncbi:hypothetical protein NP493_384g04000 [Ridgeia piscesae]|uniref:Uncharacterized protein n=1 Tax=Ridgeia piscesae TaxID=27915 RepID=A0AAD9L291_RIDPI|nr:hypothetical protein NP493_384g04000 [Ridgeia piscesae]
MDVQVQRFDDLNDRGQELAQLINSDPAAVERINGQLLEFQERWDNLVQQMEFQSKEIAHSGIDLNITKSPGGKQTITITRMEGDRTITETITTTSSKSATYASTPKRPRIETECKKEFDLQMAALNEWFDKTEINLELLTSNAADPQDQLTLEEQMVLITDTEMDIADHEITLEQFHATSGQLQEELRQAGDTTDMVDSVVTQVDQHWHDVNALLAETKQKVTTTVALKQFYDELTTLQQIVDGYEKWIRNEGSVSDEAMEICRQLEQCRVKLKAMKSHEEQVVQLGGQVAALQADGGVVENVQADLDLFNKRWTDIFEKLGTWQEKLCRALEKAPPKTYLEAMAALLKWIEGVELLLQSEPFQVTDSATMEEQVLQYRDLQGDIQDHMSNLEYLNNTGNSLVQKAPTEEKVAKLEADLKTLNSRWNDISTAVDERVDKLETAIEQLRQYQTQVLGLTRWMDEMELFLKAEVPALGDVETLEAQLQESQGVKEDVQTLQQNLDNIDEITELILLNAEKVITAKITTEVDDLKKRWAGIIQVSNDQHECLEVAMERTQKLLSQMDELSRWMKMQNEEHVEQEHAVHSQAELEQLDDAFKKLKEELGSKEGDIEEINKEFGEIVGSGSLGSLDDLTRQHTSVSDQWSAINKTVDSLHEKFHTAVNNWAKLKVLLEEEKKWLTTLEKKMAEPAKTIGDAEEVSEDLDELENFVRSRKSENEVEITALSQHLVSNHVMETSVKKELEEYQTRSQDLDKKVAQRSRKLEEAVTQAQTRESQIVEMSQWMAEVTALLQNRLDADILAGDMPKEYESLKAEFEQQQAILGNLEKLAVDYKAQGKVEAGARLEQQSSLLRKHYTEVMAKFRKFQRPVDFEPKLTHVKRVLDEIEERIHLIELRSEDPDIIQGQLDQCMAIQRFHKFYKTMSEIKPEVEYVIKTGRQVVEKKQVDFPDKLSAQLDAMKQQYNELGAQVTRGKTGLDKALKLAKKLKKEMASVREMLHSVEEIDAKEGVEGPRNLEKELQWVKDSQAEIAKRQPVLSALSDITSQLSTLSEEPSLTGAEAAVKELSEEMASISARLAKRKELLKEQADRLDQNFVDYQTMQREVAQWLETTSSVLTAADNLPLDQQVTEERIQEYKVGTVSLTTAIDQHGCHCIMMTSQGDSR